MEFPYFLTLLFGLIGYHFSEISKSILITPSIEYNRTITVGTAKNDSVKKTYEYIIRNITEDRNFQNLTINFANDDRRNSLRIFEPKIVAVEPASNQFTSKDSVDRRIIEFKISRFQPGDEYKLLFKSISKVKDEQKLPALYLTSDGAVRILETSIKTWLVKNYIFVNSILLLVWFILIIIYLYKLKSYESKTVAP